MPKELECPAHSPDLNCPQDELEHWWHPRPPPQPTSVYDLTNALVSKEATPHSHVPKSSGKHFWKCRGYYMSKSGTKSEMGCLK